MKMFSKIRLYVAWIFQVTVIQILHYNLESYKIPEQTS